MEKQRNKAETPQNAILESLKRGEHLTVQKAYRLFHTTELRKVISRLRKVGHTICATKIHDHSADGRAVVYNEYYMPL